MEGIDKYRFPSEAEWEYAARAGTITRYSFGDDDLGLSELGEYAWYKDNAGGKTHIVGTKKPNPWGLYDMHGNVQEWVQDSWYGNYDGAPSNGSVWEVESDSLRVIRGGNWDQDPQHCRSASRVNSGFFGRDAMTGFRLLQEM